VLDRADPIDLKCLTCGHLLLNGHSAEHCDCGCKPFVTGADTEALVGYMKALQQFYHFNRGEPIASNAKKAYYVILEILQARGEEAYALGQSTQRQEGPLSGV